jgi:uncharacterized protein
VTEAPKTNASQPIYDTIVDRDVMIPVRDGVKLAVDIYRPDAPGKFPVLLSQSMYGKDTQMFETPPQPFGKSIFEASIECGDACYYAKRGYAYVIADIRGSGHSEGIMEGMFSCKEGEDGHDMVEWLAKQPWCDGGVGLAGICYFSSMQLHTAAEQPPSLKCIAPWEIFADDLYNHGQYEGGVHNIFLYGLYTGTYPARCGYAPNDIRSWMEQHTDPEELKRMVDEAIADPDLKQYPYLVHLLQYPKKNPILFDFMLHKNDGPYYRERSVGERLDKINVPCYVGGPFFSFFSQPQMNVFNRVTTPKKMYLYTDMGTRPWRANHDELLRWYDYWMKGIETGIMDEPTIRYQTTGMTTWGSGETYPLETTEWTDFHFNSLEQLGTAPDYWNEEPDAFVQQPLYVTEKRNRVTYVSPPLPNDLQVVGPPRITFYASIDQDDTCWRVDVREADSDAIYPLASGWLRASHRALDPDRTTPWEIAHDHTKNVYIEPGEVNEYVVQLRPMSHLFRAGKQIKVEISAIDIPTDIETYDVMWHVCKSRTCTHKIYRDGRYPSRASLPVIPRKA